MKTNISPALSRRKFIFGAGIATTSGLAFSKSSLSQTFSSTEQYDLIRELSSEARIEYLRLSMDPERVHSSFEILESIRARAIETFGPEEATFLSLRTEDHEDWENTNFPVSEFFNIFGTDLDPTPISGFSTRFEHAQSLALSAESTQGEECDHLIILLIAGIIGLDESGTQGIIRFVQETELIELTQDAWDALTEGDFNRTMAIIEIFLIELLELENLRLLRDIMSLRNIQTLGKWALYGLIPKFGIILLLLEIEIALAEHDQRVSQCQ